MLLSDRGGIKAIITASVQAERKKKMLLGQQGTGSSSKTGFGNLMSGQLASVADKMHLGGQLGRLRAGAASIMRPGGSKTASAASASANLSRPLNDGVALRSCL